MTRHTDDFVKISAKIRPDVRARIKELAKRRSTRQDRFAGNILGFFARLDDATLTTLFSDGFTDRDVPAIARIVLERLAGEDAA